MARGEGPDTATTEFAIQLKDNSHWQSPKGGTKYGYAVFARVVEGWDIVMRIAGYKTTMRQNLRFLDDPIVFDRVTIKDSL